MTCCDNGFKILINPDGGGAAETVTSMVQNADGSISYTSENGSVFTTTPLVSEVPVFAYVNPDPLVHDVGPVEGSGTVAAPFQIPLSCCPQFEYVNSDPAVHDVGAVEGTGTVVAPFQIPVMDFPISFYPDHIAATLTAGPADDYYLNNKPTLVVALNGFTGLQETYMVRPDVNGDLVWVPFG